MRALDPISTDPLRDALALKARAGAPGNARGTPVARGPGWRVVDVVCTCGPGDHPFEERHERVSLSAVLGGSFEYRSDHGTTLLSPGSFLLGNVGRCYECGHRFGEGDRCLSFQFDPAFFEEILSEIGSPDAASFRTHRLGPLRALAPFWPRMSAALDGREPFEELALELAGAVVDAAKDAHASTRDTGVERRRVGAAIQVIREDLAGSHPLEELARASGQSRFAFLRAFKRVTGVTPHQWILRARLREAAHRLVTTSAPIGEIAFDVGFGDLSNFVRTFRAEFGASPRALRQKARGVVATTADREAAAARRSRS